ncbi:MAG: S1C family serine protease [Candidatus Binataceae bacterium]
MNASVYLLDRVSATVVGIHASVPESHPSTSVGLGSDRRGSGILVSADGLILTVNYVVMGAQSVIATLTTGEQYQARIAAQDFRSGLALLKIEASNLPYLECVSSETCALGQDVFTVASVGDESRRADSGIITYLGPFDALWEFVLDRCVMASAVNFGVGGGPLCDNKGRLVAITYLNMTDIGRSILAIPSEYFSAVRDELTRFGKRVSAPPRAWLGLLSYTLREHVIIAGVMPGGPSDKAGLKQGDMVLAVDGHDVTERRAFYDAVWSHRPGERVRFKILRNNQVQTIEVPGIRIEDYFG